MKIVMKVRFLVFSFACISLLQTISAAESDIINCVKKQKFTYARLYLIEGLGLEPKSTFSLIMNENVKKDHYSDAETMCKNGTAKPEKVAAACFALGRIWEQRKKSSVALDYYKKSCEKYNYPYGCQRLDQLTESDKYLRSSVDVLEKQCQSKKDNACYVLASYKECSENDLGKVMSYLEKRLSSLDKNAQSRDKTRIYFYKLAQSQDDKKMQRMEKMYRVQIESKYIVESLLQKMKATAEVVDRSKAKRKSYLQKQNVELKKLETLMKKSGSSKEYKLAIAATRGEVRRYDKLLEEENKILMEQREVFKGLDQEYKVNMKIVDENLEPILADMKKVLAPNIN